MVAYDPGTGPGRYEKALTILRDSGGEMAMASFTFDPEEEGSMVLVPAQVIEARVRPGRDPLPPGRVTSDGIRQWKAGADRALELLDQGLVKKIVLSRQISLEFAFPLPQEEVVRKLTFDQPDCYTFAVDGLIGSSPELLASLLNGEVRSLALAGTAGVSEDLDSATMAVEHGLTATAVKRDLAHHVTNLQQRASVLEYGRIRHLATLFQGKALPRTTVLDLVASLHPTPAVAGEPSGDALRLIRDMEADSRGRYAGPVGWFNRQGEGEFALALRCGLVNDNRVTLYAGGGLVPGAIADHELEETELKFEPMFSALGLSTGGGQAPLPASPRPRPGQ